MQRTPSYSVCLYLHIPQDGAEDDMIRLVYAHGWVGNVRICKDTLSSPHINLKLNFSLTEKRDKKP